MGALRALKVARKSVQDDSRKTQNKHQVSYQIGRHTYTTIAKAKILEEEIERLGMDMFQPRLKYDIRWAVI